MDKQAPWLVIRGWFRYHEVIPRMRHILPSLPQSWMFALPSSPQYNRVPYEYVFLIYLHLIPTTDASPCAPKLDPFGHHLLVFGRKASRNGIIFYALFDMNHRSSISCRGTKPAHVMPRVGIMCNPSPCKHQTIPPEATSFIVPEPNTP